MGIQIRLSDVTHRYGEGKAATVEALHGISLEVSAGEFAVIMGPSGSGKSTILHLIGAVEQPTAGTILLDETDIATLGERELTGIRRQKIGFVFQFFHLIPTLTVEENVSFPLLLLGTPKAETRQRAKEVLEQTGLSGRSHHYPSELSGGEMQRVAIGRAVAHRPPLILADEPTGNLDLQTGDAILDLLARLREQYQPTIVMATHSGHAASWGDKIVRITDGRLTDASP
ncbi:MAG: ABC transporter ATP-binding protein [Thermoanaerobaculia bacterium]|nr:ABC transporter ATP-binding protein [Thermoanaerobaculia bacterium]